MLFSMPIIVRCFATSFLWFPVILGRPARVFWDLEHCSVGGKDYANEIMRTIQSRVEADTGHDIFEIYASYMHASHIPAEVYQELVAWDVRVNFSCSAAWFLSISAVGVHLAETSSIQAMRILLLF